MALIDELIARGLVQDLSDLDSLRSLKPGDKCYAGFDPTSPSLQVGNLVPLTMLIRLGRAGVIPVPLFGGATGFIGDPSGKNVERQLLDKEMIERNILSQGVKVREIFNRAGISPEVVNNNDWTSGVGILEFLRDVGKFFTVNYMISKEAVKNRLNGDGISFTEFSYMLLQAFDFYHLYSKAGCRLQIGGSDQWGNMTAGLELIRKKCGETNAAVFSLPLLTNAEGKKFGKSESGAALWLDASMTSPYAFYQFWLNTADSDVIQYLKVFTLFTDAEIEKLESSLNSMPEQRGAQMALADSVTTLVHGSEATAFAKKSSAVLFGGSIDGITEAELIEIFSDVPSSEIPRETLKGHLIADLLVLAGAVKSKGEAKRLITGGGVYINSERIGENTGSLEESPFYEKSVLVLRTGKKNYHLVKLV